MNLDALFVDAPRVDLLKCDIEGAELLFLQNYPELLRKVRVAIFEFHADLCDVHQCRRLLRDYGFPQHRILRESGPYSLECVRREAATRA